MIYGYARVSSKDQDLTVQLEQLSSHVPDGNIYKEKVSGRNKDARQEFNKLLAAVREGDTIYICKLDRFARSTLDALNTIADLNNRGVALVVLNLGGQAVDTSSPTGKLFITMLAAVAEFEVDINRERRTEGIALAKAAGKYKGRPRQYGPNNKAYMYAKSLYENRNENGMTVAEICEVTGIGRTTLYNAVK